jgi:hypothetical protein
MTQFVVKDAGRWHCGQMARQIRVDQAAGTRDLGFKTHEGIATAFAMSSTRKAWLIDGRLGALGGMIDTLGSGVGIIWLSITQDATRYPVTMFKTARAWLELFTENKSALRTTIVISDKASVEFANRLGFLATGERTNDGKLAVMEYNCGGRGWLGLRH